MKSNISIENMNGPAGEFLLVNVTGGGGVIGICDTSVKGDITRETFHIGNESIINVRYPTGSDDSSRMIWQTASIEKTKNTIGTTRLPKACDAYFQLGMPLNKAIAPILEMLVDGIYVVHTGTVFPTDGAGNFFWNAYAVKHEVTGTAAYNPIIGSEKCFSPPFLIPTSSAATCTESSFNTICDKIRDGKRFGGIAFHISGMFSALLTDHVNATACLACGVDFECIIIEPLRNIVFGDAGSIDEGKAIALGCPFVKMYFDDMPRSMAENYLLHRKHAAFPGYEEICWKAEKGYNGGVLPRKLGTFIDDNVGSCPDAEMMASAFAIDELTEEDIQLLLSGTNIVDEHPIISANYYESLVYAANYLQLKDKKRFISFARSIIENTELSAAHGYLVGRLKYVMDAKVNEIFKFINSSENPVYDALKPTAEKYFEAYSYYSEGNVHKFLNNPVPASAQQAAATAPRSAVEDIREHAENMRGAPALNSDGSLSSLELARHIEKAMK